MTTRLPSTGPDAASRAPRRRTTPLTNRWSRAVILVGAVAAGTITVSGCDFPIDTPLSLTSATRAVAPGDPITGKVIYPDGHITVTIAPFASPRNTELHRTAGEKGCEYHRLSKKYSCPTTDLEQGLYIVQVTDAAQPGEGTAEAQVAVTDAVNEAGGYNPQIVISNADGEAEAGPATLTLTGWRPAVAVRMRMIDENNKTVFTGTAVPDTRGAATVRTPFLKVGHYNLSATDGLWKFSGDEGAQNDVYGGLEVS